MKLQHCPVAIDPSGTDVHGEIRRIRAHGPVVPVALPGGVNVWSVTSAAPVRQLMTDPRVSKDAYRHWPAWINGEIPASWPLAIWVSVRSMITAYGTDHDRLRKLVSKAFTARRTAALRPRVEEITAELLDGLQRVAPGQPVDLRAEFACPLPVRVICELLGIPEEARDGLREVIDITFLTAVSPEEVMENGLKLYTALNDLVEVKRAHPGDDLASALIAVRDEHGEDRLSDQELVDTLLLMISAGYETTVNLFDNTVHALLTHPEQRALLDEGEVSWEDVIEETLRVDPPGAHIPFRYAVEDIELGDVVIAKGEPILISMAGVGRDPDVHGADADVFDARRATRREHVTFGHGVHYCLGAPLARMEATIALSALFERFPGIALADPDKPLRPLPSFLSNGHQELPVVLR
ncbi:cytochrome P450 family protein [Streptomyces cavernae]|uniref:cytochrome P450 family protein n=1 Tax=Streptomyces cavernae TaxID=2259034 RepID=UPI000FEBF8F9|nr:cytochrome P450 [Streptomyces cavernae]